MSVTVRKKEQKYLHIKEDCDSVGRVSPNDRLIKWMTEVNMRDEYISLDFIKSINNNNIWFVYEIDPPF